MTRALAAVFALSACASAQIQITPERATALERELTGQRRFLKVSMFVTPFFGDATHKLLTPVPPEEVRLLDDTAGKPISPGDVERVVPAGTPVRITKVEFPTTTMMAQRLLYTPRTLLWVHVELPNARTLPFVLVLRPGLNGDEQVRGELARALTMEDPTPVIEHFSDAVREGVRTKTAVVEMSAEALEMAWGWPESKRIELVGSSKKERWSWPNRRAATVVDGRVTELTP
jgi:hypothetical protein